MDPANLATHVGSARSGSIAKSPNQRDELTVEAVRALQERHVSDAVVPGGLGRRTYVEDVLRHGRQHHAVRAAMGDQEGQTGICSTSSE